MAESMWVFPFGKYKGKGIEDVPSDYLDWCLGEDWFCKKFRHGAEQIAQELGYRKQHNIEPDEEDSGEKTKEEERQNERDSWW